MSALIVALRLLAVSQLLLLAAMLARGGSRVRPRAAGMALALCVICYLMLPLVAPYLDAARLLPAMLANAVPPILLWFTWELFEDRQRVPRSIVIAGFAYLAVVAAVWLPVRPDHPPALAAGAIQLCKLGFALAAVIVVSRGRQADLVERRLRLRRVFMAGIALMTAAVVVTELVTAWAVPMVLELAGMAGIFALALIANLTFLQPGTLLLREAGTPVPTDVVPEDPLLAELVRSMRDERVYADHDLRIGTLAGRLGVPEYRLRRAINQQLGHRNFNQFVNGYRIDEAARRLITERDMPVLTVALDVGFRSMSSFNTAFRERFDVFPANFAHGRRRKTENSDRISKSGRHY